MKTFILKNAPFLLLLFSLYIPFGSIAQKTKKLYYPDGTIAFEGNYNLNWSVTEPFEFINLYNPYIEIRQKHSDRDYPSILIYKDIIPNRNFIGKCKFYYPNGKLMAEGKYKDGNKEGLFKLFHPNGTAGAIQYYSKGMATGTWETWDKKGNLTAQCSYKPIPDKLIEEIITGSIAEDKLNNSNTNKLLGKVYREWHYLEVFDYLKNPVIEYHSNRIYTFTQYLKNDRFRNLGFIHGSYKTWENQLPELEMNFSNNNPTGIWKLYEHGKLVFEMAIEKDSVIRAKDFTNPENNYGTSEYVERKRKEEENKMLFQNRSNNAVEPGLIGAGTGAKPHDERTNENEIYNYVQEKAHAPYSYMEYIANNIRYPKEAKDNEIEGRVNIKFVVRKDGSIDKAEVVRKVHPLLDAEALRVVKSMPKWKPGKQNGKVVDSYFTIPITFKLQ